VESNAKEPQMRNLGEMGGISGLGGWPGVMDRHTARVWQAS